MKLYRNLTRCRFLYRVNRFVAKVDVDGQEVAVHIKNTGRLGELLVPGAPGWLEAAASPERKTPFDLVAVMKAGQVVNVDSQCVNAVFREWLTGGGYAPEVSDIRAELTLGDSRFDFTYQRNGRLGVAEVKGVTLVEDGRALFPDAPTERGVKHLRGLMALSAKGMEAGVCFVIPREDARAFSPHDLRHAAFGQALREAVAAGVRVTAALCRVSPDSVTITGTIPVIL